MASVGSLAYILVLTYLISATSKVLDEESLMILSIQYAHQQRNIPHGVYQEID
jgi:hypothetical protein